MNSFAFLLLCIQACLSQAAYRQCDYGCAPAIDVAVVAANAAADTGAANAAARATGWRAGLPFLAAYGPAMTYSGNGAGNVAVAGELGVAGSTLIAGQVPVLGAVQFNGQVPAAGAVTISGSCGCGCGY